MFKDNTSFFPRPAPSDMIPRMKAAFLSSLFLAAGLLLEAGCNRSAAGLQTNTLRIAATTAILGDVVSQIGGTNIHLTVLLKPGKDPHTFNPTPADLAALSQSRILFANGLGLEGFLPRLPKGPVVVEVSADLPLLKTVGGDEHGHEAHSEGAADPHVWFDPMNVMAWVDRIGQSLAAEDPAHAQEYAERAESYKKQLSELHNWIQQQTAVLPPERRKLVCDHAVLNYFAGRYGFTVAGVIIPGYSSAAEPSARALASLEDTIRNHRIPALFLTSAASPSLAQRLAEDTGVKVAVFYDGSLSGPDGPASTYLDFMRHNVSVFVNALKE